MECSQDCDAIQKSQIQQVSPVPGPADILEMHAAVSPPIFAFLPFRLVGQTILNPDLSSSIHPSIIFLSWHQGFLRVLVPISL